MVISDLLNYQYESCGIVSHLAFVFEISSDKYILETNNLDSGLSTFGYRDNLLNER